MAERPISDQFILRLKAATRDLVNACGGVERAGAIAGLSKSQISRCQGAGAPDVIDMPSALALEHECGLPAITTVMAEMHGRQLSDGIAAASAASVLERHAELMRGAAATASQMALALADLVITPAEAEAIDRSLSDQEATIRSMRAGLAAIRASGSACASAPLSGLRAV